MSTKTRRLLRLYEDELHLRFASSTRKSRLSVLGPFLRWLFARGLDLSEVRTEDLQAYQNELHALRKGDGRPLSLGHQLSCLCAIRSFFRFLYRRGVLLHNPAAAVELPRQEKRLPRTVLSPSEARRLLEAAQRPHSARELRNRAILETFYATGIRCGELSHLRLYDVDTEERVLKVRNGKGAKDRHVPLTRKAAEAIEAYLEKGRSELLSAKKAPFLFLADKGGFLQVAVLNKMVRRYASKAAIRKHITCHTFRHSVATHLLKGRADIRHIQALLGHESLSTTQIYTRVEISDLKEVLRRAHPRGR